MKKMFLILFLMSTFVLGNSQKSISKYFDSLNDVENCSVFKVNKEMFELLSALDTDDVDDIEFQDLVSDLNEITVYIFKNRAESEYKTLKNLVDSENLKSYMSFKENNDHFNLYASGKNADGKLKDIVFIAMEEDETIFIEVDGAVNINALAKIVKNVKIDGLDKLKKIEEKED